MTGPAEAWLRARLDDADVHLDPGRVGRVWRGALVGAVAGGLVVGGPGLAVVAGLAVAGAPAVALRLARGRAQARYAAALPAALEAVAAGLRSGASLVVALGEAATASPPRLAGDLAEIVARTARGSTLVEALESWPARRPWPPVRLAVAALCLGVETGGAQARAIDGVAATLRDQAAVAGEVRALTSQVRASAAVISLAPLGFGAVAAVADPRSAAFLLRTPVGLACLATGLVLDAVAALWMARLCRSPA